MSRLTREEIERQIESAPALLARAEKAEAEVARLKEALEAAKGLAEAYCYCGDILNDMDAVEDEDMEYTNHRYERWVAAIAKLEERPDI